jgi:hypothetical protein
MARSNRPPTEERLDDFEVMYVEAVGGLNGAPAAFRDLEGRLDSLRGRRFYGTLHGERYRVCVIPKDAAEPAALGLATWTIPGGRYARRKLVDWAGQEHRIGEQFDAMAAEHSWDETRPSIEFYRSLRELILYLPVLG